MRNDNDNLAENSLAAHTQVQEIREGLLRERLPKMPTEFHMKDSLEN
jgi:hypothetical protein